MVPHFEKMLYDQAMLAMAFVETYQATGKEEHARTAREIFEYVLSGMTSPEGGFYSAEDADSEGEEGKYYLWTVDEVMDLLGPEDGRTAGFDLTIIRVGAEDDDAEFAVVRGCEDLHGGLLLTIEHL